MDFHRSEDECAKEFGVEVGTAILKHHFVLVTEEEARDLRKKQSAKALESLGRKVKFLNELPVPDVD